MALVLFTSLVFVLGASHPLIQSESRIVNGISSSFSSYPFIAAIRDIEIDARGHDQISEAWCGGSVIRKTYPAAILTAGHCVYQTTNQLIVQLNASDTRQTPVIGISSWRVLYIATHEQFDSFTLENDIAILFIDVDLSNRDDLSTVTLPSTATCCSSGDAFEIIGYGRIGLGGRYSKTLEHTNLEYLDTNACNEKMCLYETRSANCKFSYATEKNICGLGDQTTPCHGDSGSPLVIKGTMEQVGVVSWGIDCAHSIPTIFTNTAVFYEWINEKLNLYTGRATVAANGPPVESIRTTRVTDSPLIIHHMLTTEDVSNSPTIEPTEDPTNPFYAPTLVVPAPTALTNTETTDMDGRNESNHGVIYRLRSVIVTGLGFAMIFCTLVTTALCCKRKRKDDEEYTTDVLSLMERKEINSNPYIITL